MNLGNGEHGVLLLAFESASLSNLDHFLEEALEICSQYGGQYTRTQGNDKWTRISNEGEREGAAGTWRENFIQVIQLKKESNMEIAFITWLLNCWVDFPIFLLKKELIVLYKCNFFFSFLLPFSSSFSSFLFLDTLCERLFGFERIDC